MLKKTSGIILKTTKYSEGSLIVKIYTKDFGLQSYLVNSVRNKKSKNKLTAFQPLSIVDIEVIHSEKRTLQRISEVNIQYFYKKLHFDILKSSISIFINELIYKVLKEEQPDEDLFEFILDSLKILDNSQGKISNFPIVFLLEFSKHLGFYPQGIFSESSPYFDLQEGMFVSITPFHPYYLDKDLSLILSQLLKFKMNEDGALLISNSSRKNILNVLIEFYALHIHSFSGLKSHKVLEEIIN